MALPKNPKDLIEHFKSAVILITIKEKNDSYMDELVKKMLVKEFTQVANKLQKGDLMTRSPFEYIHSMLRSLSTLDGTIKLTEDDIATQAPTSDTFEGSNDEIIVQTREWTIGYIRKCCLEMCTDCLDPYIDVEKYPEDAILLKKTFSEVIFNLEAQLYSEERESRIFAFMAGNTILIQYYKLLGITHPYNFDGKMLIYGLTKINAIAKTLFVPYDEMMQYLNQIGEDEDFFNMKPKKETVPVQ
jgi:hypothetical protein